MELTKEQKDIVAYNGNMIINATAGSGKTSVLVAYAKERKDKQFLYVTFNKSMQMDAEIKFKSNDIGYVKTSTVHSLAYNSVKASKFKLSKDGLRAYDIVKLLKLSKKKVPSVYHFILAGHIIEYFNFYCNNAERDFTISFERYHNSLPEDSKARAFVESSAELILGKTVDLWALMNKKKADITHDFYLKLFQLSNPDLSNYGYILLDEGQDASPVMLDIIKNQNTNKIIVGDTHQQLYSFRHAVNSLEGTDYEKFDLTESFRFGDTVAFLAKKVVEYKNYVGLDINYKIKEYL